MYIFHCSENFRTEKYFREVKEKIDDFKINILNAASIGNEKDKAITEFI